MPGYRLLDSGNRQKLEEIVGQNGTIRIMRAEPRAWWKLSLPENEWEKAKASYIPDERKGWKFKEVSGELVIDVTLGINAKIKFGGNSRHIGIFPEQAGEWEWIANKLERCKLESKNKVQTNVLNLFGYTGIASLVSAKAGAKVTHVDASKQSVDWARDNQKLSGLQEAPIRWIVDDVLKFLKKEVRQGKKYDAIIMDPPSYGKGPKGEVWKIEDKISVLLEACKEILSDNPIFIILNMYSTELSSISAANLLSDISLDLGGQVVAGELAIKQENSDRLLPLSIFAIWESKI